MRGLGGELTDGEVIDAAGLRIKVMATPGHTADSLCFLLDDAVLTADTVLGRGTTVLDKEDGSLTDYLESLRRLRGLGRRAVLPGHGPDLTDLESVAQGYLEHRRERLDQVRSAVRSWARTSVPAGSSNTSTSMSMRSCGTPPVVGAGAVESPALGAIDVTALA